MEEQREVGETNMPPVPVTLNYKCRTQTSTLEDSNDYFQVVPVPSYAPNVHANTSRKLSRMKDNERRKTSLNKIDTGLIKLTNENQKRQKSSPSSPHCKSSPPSPAWRAESTGNTNDLSDWLLLGKSIQDPGCSSATKKDQRNIGNELYFLPKKEEESGKNHFCSGLHTYPPSIAKCSDPEHLRKINSENEDYSAEKDRHHWYPSFSVRPLGEPCTTNYSGWQKLRNKTNVGGDKKLDEIMAAGRQAQFSQRKTVSPSSLRNSSSAQLLRSSSSSSLIKYTPRSRSISLPTHQAMASLHYNVVFDWEEKRNNGITYVTPLFQTSEPERFSSVGLSADYDNEPSCEEHEVKPSSYSAEDSSLEHDELRKL